MNECIEGDECYTDWMHECFLIAYYGNLLCKNFSIFCIKFRIIIS